jgi:hypothetical protein
MAKKTPITIPVTLKLGKGKKAVTGTMNWPLDDTMYGVEEMDDAQFIESVINAVRDEVNVTPRVTVTLGVTKKDPTITAELPVMEGTSVYNDLVAETIDQLQVTSMIKKTDAKKAREALLARQKANSGKGV